MILPVFLIVIISISTAMILDCLTNLHLGFLNLYIILGVLFVFFLNIIKFFIWNFLHKKYDLSSTYPMTAIYFPLIYIISVIKGEVQVNILSLSAIICIFLGVYIIFKEDKEEVI